MDIQINGFLIDKNEFKAVRVLQNINQAEVEVKNHISAFSNFSL